MQQKLSRFEGYRGRHQQKEATAKPEGPYWEMPVEEAPRSMQIDEDGAPDVEMNETVEEDSPPAGLSEAADVEMPDITNGLHATAAIAAGVSCFCSGVCSMR